MRCHKRKRDFLPILQRRDKLLPVPTLTMPISMPDGRRALRKSESEIATGDVPIGADKAIASSGRLSFKAATILDRSDADAEFSAARAVNAVVANAFRGSAGPGEEKSRIAVAARMEERNADEKQQGDLHIDSLRHPNLHWAVTFVVNTYPAERTVWIMIGLRGSFSIFCRSRLIVISTLRSVAAADLS